MGTALLGARLGGQYTINESASVFINSSVERRNYGGQDSIFLVTRSDTQYNLSLGLDYSPAKNWKITPQVGVTRNNSNIAINEYTRELYTVTLRRDF